jgi:hypothetical protein
MLQGATGQRSATTGTRCSGVVVVDSDGSFTCSAVCCRAGDSQDPWMIAKDHSMFVSSDHASLLTAATQAGAA